jgi:hypothetical protein
MNKQRISSIFFSGKAQKLPLDGIRQETPTPFARN